MANYQVAILCIVGTLLDGILTYLGMARGFQEGNPLLAATMDRVGIVPALVLTRVLSITAICWIATVAPRRYLWYLAAFFFGACVVPWTVLLVTGDPTFS